MAIVGVGPLSSKICIVNGEAPTFAASLAKKPLVDWHWEFLKKSLLKAGIHPNHIRLIQLSQNTIQELNSMPNLNVIIPLGGAALTAITGKVTIDKWHLSPLDTVTELHCRKAIPAYGTGRTNAEYKLQLFTIKTFEQAKKVLEQAGPWKRKPYNFYLNPKFDDTIDILKSLLDYDILANDIETGNGIINTVGFAWSDNDGIAINTLPERLSGEKYYLLWSLICKILEQQTIGKIYQNSIYETMYYSKYGIKVKNTYHDTMWAQRVLYPEFKIGLDNVGRMYTNEPYWKDTGKDYKSEGGKRDWGNIRDWPAHYRYNCLDTTGTFEACGNQRRDLDKREQLEWFSNYVMRVGRGPIVEMCSRGLPIDESRRAALEERTTAEVDTLVKGLSEPINPNSSKQKIELFKKKRYYIPVKKGKQSMDELSLKKMRLKYPEDTDIAALLKIAKLNKSLSSYIKCEYDADQVMRFSLQNGGTETFRFAGHKDAWGKGLNVQTLPPNIKPMFVAPPGKIWINVDLKQAESRYVAYRSRDAGMIDMLEDDTKDIHRYVASHIFNVPESEVTKDQRNKLGKKSGHGANYDMGPPTFVDSCLKELDLVLTVPEGKRILDTYHNLFPGVRRYHEEIKQQLYNTRCLTNPFGYARYFYGRMNDSTFKEAYAFEPQSTIPMIVNYLMLYLCEERDNGKLDFNLHLQCHDSLTFMTDDNPDKYLPLVQACHDTNRWHPEIVLPAGKLIIPTEAEIGYDLGTMETVQL